MKEKEIFEYNKMCLRFLGLDNIQHLEENRYLFARMVYTVDDPDPKAFLIDLACNPKNLGHIEFYNDWNWIHKIVKKINETEFNGMTLAAVHSLLFNSKSVTVKKIYEYLKWYYENK
jgi:hypothetical protein